MIYLHSNKINVAMSIKIFQQNKFSEEKVGVPHSLIASFTPSGFDLIFHSCNKFLGPSFTCGASCSIQRGNAKQLIPHDQLPISSRTTAQKNKIKPVSNSSCQQTASEHQNYTVSEQDLMNY